MGGGIPAPIPHIYIMFRCPIPAPMFPKMYKINAVRLEALPVKLKSFRGLGVEREPFSSFCLYRGYTVSAQKH